MIELAGYHGANDELEREARKHQKKGHAFLPHEIVGGPGSIDHELVGHIKKGEGGADMFGMNALHQHRRGKSGYCIHCGARM